MRSLESRDSFVDKRRVPALQTRKRNFTKPLAVIIMLLVVIAGISLLLTINNPSEKGVYQGSSMMKVVPQDFGAGYKNPQVISADNYFVVGTVNKGALTLHLIDASDGSEVTSSQVVSDVNSYYFRIAYDSSADEVMVLWINGTGSLNYTFVTGISGGALNPSGTINNLVTNAGTTGIGLAGDNNGHFFAVWSDTSYHNHYVIVKTDGSHDSNFPDVSSDTHSHAQNFAAYDPTTNHFIVVWRNYSGLTGLYNITAKLFYSDGRAASGDILVGDGVAANTKYDYPSVEGGNGKFAIAYVNYNSPYDIHLTIMDASSGSISATVDVGNTAKYGRSYVGIAYNGTGFTVDWTNESYDIVANNYDPNGNPAFSQPKAISATSDSEEWQDVAYNPNTQTYYFVWYDYTDKDDHGSLWTENEYVPEFNAFIPLLAVLFVVPVVLRRRL